MESCIQLLVVDPFIFAFSLLIRLRYNETKETSKLLLHLNSEILGRAK